MSSTPTVSSTVSSAVTVSSPAVLSLDVPELIKTKLAAVKDTVETQAFLTITAVSTSLEAMATTKAQKMSPIEFQTWAQGVGELLQEQFGSNVQAITVTEGNMALVKDLIQQLSKDLGEIATVSETKLMQELRSNNVTLKKQGSSFDSHSSTAWSAFQTHGALKHPEGKLDREDLLCARLYSMDKGQLSTVCYTTVNEGFWKFASFDAGIKAEGKEIMNLWKFFIFHLNTAISELKGTTGVFYRGQTHNPYDDGTLKPGGVIVLSAFTSCSANKETALRFANQKLMYEINIPTEYGASIKEYSIFKTEDELLLPPGTSFRVDGIEKGKDGYQWYLKMTCLGVTATPQPTAPLVDLAKQQQQQQKKQLQDDFWTALSEGNALFFLHNKLSVEEGFLKKEWNSKGETALFVAARYSGNAVIILWLLARHVGLDEKCQDGATALHGAALGKHKGAIKVLLRKGAKRDVENKKQLTVMEESPDIMKEVLGELETEENYNREDVVSLKRSARILEGQIAEQNKELRKQADEINELKKHDAERDQEIQELKKAVAGLLNKK